MQILSSMAILPAAEKLQMLADALAADFSRSQASAACTGALSRLLPGLQYLSVALSNPALGGSLVMSSNYAMEGPTTLHLHDPLFSAAGRALALGKPLATSLRGDAAAAVLPAWTDVQLMVAHAPGIAHLLCVPFGSASSEEGGNGSGAAATDSRCQQHWRQGSGRGALLFGFSAPPELDARRKAMLAVLAQCLPAPMARLSADTLAFVNFACGSNAQCSCCCSADEEGERKEEAGLPDSPCREDDRGEGSGGGASPSQALRVPSSGGAAVALEPDLTAGPSHRRDDNPGEGCSKAAAAAAAAAPAAAAAAAPAAAPAAAAAAAPVAGQPALGRIRSSSQATAPAADPSQPRFPKALLAAVAEEGGAVLAQHAVTLAFVSSQAEAVYAKWISKQHLRGDILFSLLLLSALTIVAFVQPYRLVSQSVTTCALAVGAIVPLLLSWYSRIPDLLRWREVAIAVMRLYIVGCLSLVGMRAYQALLPLEGRPKWVTLWRLSGAEGLAVTAIGFRTRLRLHLLVHCMSLAVVLYAMPSMCEQGFASMPPAHCVYSSAAMAAFFGYLAPTAALRYQETHLRSTFARLLRAAAAHEH